MPTEESLPPRTFISYRWSSPEHEEWVLAFATTLRSYGVDAILDKWHLKEGQDTLAFMESMVTDAAVTKVLLICDEGYVDRADNRLGGVGTEAQIISAKVYASVDQQKFAAVVKTLNEDGKPILPAYMASRLYFDMSSPEAEALNIEKIVRWIYDKPFHVAPEIGARPSFLDQSYSPRTLLRSDIQQLDRLKARGDGQSAAVAGNLLSKLSRTLPDLRMDLAKNSDQEADDLIYDAITETAEFREASYSAMAEVVLSGSGAGDQIHLFFESMASELEWRPNNGSFTRWDNDVIKFVVDDLLVSFVAIAMSHRRFEVISDVLNTPLYFPRPGEITGEPKTYPRLSQEVNSLIARNTRKNLRRISLRADLLTEFHRKSSVSEISYLEADFTLYIRGLIAPNYRWYPSSSLYLANTHGILPSFSRATSNRFYERMKIIFFDKSASELRTDLLPYTNGTKQGIQFGYWDLDIAKLANLEGLGTAA